MTRRIILFVKIIWLIATISLLIWLVSTHWEDFTGYANELDTSSLVLSFISLVIAKLLLAFVSSESLRSIGQSFSYVKIFHIYSISQLGKYLPGSVWQYVGKLLLYRIEGIPPKDGSKVLLLESFWLFTAALILGLSASANQLLSKFGFFDLPWFTSPDLLILIGVLFFFFAIRLGSFLMAKIFNIKTRSSLLISFLQMAIWGSLGISFWLLFPSDIRQPENLIIATGAFALGWVIGYLAVFAPAGVGVREAVIVYILSDTMGVPVAVAVASLSRLVYSVLDLVLGIIAIGWYSRCTNFDLHKLLNLKIEKC
jgi:hypothetical protein